MTIRLDPLTATETDTLLATNEGLAADPDKRREIVEAAAGVPLFAEQMAALRSEGARAATVRALMQRVSIGCSQKSERFLNVPQSRARSSTERPFPRSSADRLTSRSALMGLVRREFVRPERSAEGGERFRFSHALLRDAVYEQMAHRLRSQLHEQFADLLSSTDGDAELIGHQLERAYAEERSWVRPTRRRRRWHCVPVRHSMARCAAHGVAARSRSPFSEPWGWSRSPRGRSSYLVALVRAYNELADWDGAERVHAALWMPRAYRRRRTSGSRWHWPSWRPMPRQRRVPRADPGDRRPRR